MEPLNEGFLDFIKKKSEKIIKAIKSSDHYQESAGTIHQIRDFFLNKKLPDSVSIEFSLPEKVLNGSFEKKMEMQIYPFPPFGKDDKFYDSFIDQIAKKSKEKEKLLAQIIGNKKKVKLNFSQSRKLFDVMSKYHDKYDDIQSIVGNNDESFLFKYYPDMKEAFSKIKNKEGKYALACERVLDARCYVILHKYSAVVYCLNQLREIAVKAKYHYAAENRNEKVKATEK